MSGGRLSAAAQTTLAFALVAALLVAMSIPAIAAGRFPDSDDVLRMVQVRDLIAGQGWFDLTQHRIDASGGGVPMHWSRLVDLPLAAVVVLLTPLFGQAGAETAAAIVVPLLTLGCAFALVARLAQRLCGAEAVGFACFALALSAPVLSQVLPLRVDHHGWQIVLALGAVSGLMARDAVRCGWIAGAALAGWLAISIEGLPMAAALTGITALRWLREPAGKAWFVHTMLALASCSVLLFLATRGLADLATHCDALAPVHMAVFGWGAVGALALAAWNPAPRTLLVVGLAAIAAGGVALMLAVAPQCAGGGFAELDPIVERYWYLGVGEGLPLWRQPLPTVLQTLLPTLAGLWGALALRRAAEGERRKMWEDYALALAAALAIAMIVTRAGAVAGALAAVPLGWQVRDWLTRLRAARAPVRLGVLFAAVALAVLAVLPRNAPQSPGQASSQRASTCAIAEAAPFLASLPKGEILAPLDIGPRLLYHSPHTVVASAHHRGQRGIRQAIELFTGPTDEARQVLERRGTAYAALCPDIHEVAALSAAAPNGLLADLASGRAPDWLEPLPVPPESNLKVWKVAR